MSQSSRPLDGTPQVTIRQIGAAELAPLLSLYRDLNPDDLPLDPEAAEGIFRDLLRSRTIEVWVADLGGVLVASELSEARGSYKVMLQSGSTNPATKAFYKSLGFRDDEKTAYVIRDDVPKVRY